MALAVVVFSMANMVLASGWFITSSGRSLREVLADDFAPTIAEVGVAATGVLLASVGDRYPLGVLVVGLPVVLMLQRALMHTQLVRASRVDGKTGLLHARAFNELATVAAGSDDGRPTALLMLDLDHFKQVNDVHGHLVGDEVLRRVADVLRATVRDTDLVARFGGEEFCVLTAATSDEARRLAERLRDGVATMVVGRGALDGLRVTTSVGLAVGADDLTVLFERADAALYRAKAAGRNCVRVAGSEVPARR